MPNGDHYLAYADMLFCPMLWKFAEDHIGKACPKGFAGLSPRLSTH
jgi:hypothetical protein